MSARSLQAELHRQLNQRDPANEACDYCRGSGVTEYGRCGDCDGAGWAPRETYRHQNIAELHERPEHEAAALDWTFFYSHAAEA